MEFLKSNNVVIQTTSQFSTLGMIDRFVITLRDMNTPKESSKCQSHDEKYRSFTVEKMN